MDKQMDFRIAGANTENSADWQSLSDLELASIGGGIGDTVLAAPTI